MNVSKENQLELVVSSTMSSFQEMLDAQMELFRSQIDILQNIVGKQCNLTGVNPLSQEMAAGALSIKIGKRPRDLLNPKAIKYMQSVFSIKDVISKKECREISALFGVTATQVREFFTGQRTRVRKFVRLSREKAIRSNLSKEEQQEEALCSDLNMPIDSVPLNTVCPPITEGPSCPTKDEALPGINDSDKHFVENIFILMRKEETFSGQMKLMEWILEIQTPSVLHWFLTEGGIMILATWLSQAAAEEQTTTLHIIIKVLCHLPLHKALPAHMAAILYSVNRLRFYRTSDISNRAKVLLSRWSKMFARSQAMKKPNAMKSSTEVQDEMLLKQSIGEIMGNESWDTKVDNSEETSTQSSVGPDNLRKLETSHPLKLLTSSTDESNKKLIRGSSSQTRERRKVQLVEQPGQKAAGRSSQIVRSVTPTKGRPLSADDIQKAKMRAQFMQSKYGKTGIISDERSNKSLSSQVIMSPSASRSYVRPKVEEQKKPEKLLSTQSNLQVAPFDNKMSLSLDIDEPLSKKCKRVQILWQTPPEMRIDSEWRCGTGENSKEVDVQKRRICREKETMYNTIQDIPLNPKEPWDIEMDYDDTLTPEIPTEQLPDNEVAESSISPLENQETPPVTSVASVPQSSSSNGNGNMPEPDLELLAVLLKNPELVFALTSAQGGSSISSEDTVKLLDMIKANGVSSLATTGVQENVQVSLPSPTPSSNPVTSQSGWRPEIAKNPFSRQNADFNGGSAMATVKTQVPRLPIVSAPAQPTIPQLPMLQTATTNLPEKRPRLTVPSSHQSSPEIVQNMNKFSVVSLPRSPNMLATASSSQAVFSMPPLLPIPTQQSQVRQQPPAIPEEARLSAPPPSWRDRQGVGNAHAYPHPRSNNYNAFGGLVHPGPPWNRNEMRVDPGFESWSPEGSPARPQPRLSYGEARMNLGHNNYGFERPGPRNPGYWEVGRNGSRRWREHRR